MCEVERAPRHEHARVLGTLGLAPQLIFWIWITIAFGALFGIVAAAIARQWGTAAA
jgi:hypothetical protein